jgi:hypothetical protein
VQRRAFRRPASGAGLRRSRPYAAETPDAAAARQPPTLDARRRNTRQRKMPVPRNYSDNYLSGMDPDPKRNVAVECFQIDTTRFATTYIVLILIVYGAIHGSGYTSEQSLSATNVAHALVTFVFFHWAKGSPDTHAQGDYDDLTVWEQLDGGASWSATKKVFLIVPTLVLLAYLNAADFSRQALTIHVPIYALLCILPKLPGMHRVRILGINRTVGFDESFDDEAKKGS